MVSPSSVKLNLDCQQVAEKEIKEAGNTSADGYQVLGKMSKSIGSKGDSATVSRSFLNCAVLFFYSFCIYKKSLKAKPHINLSVSKSVIYFYLIFFLFVVLSFFESLNGKLGSKMSNMRFHFLVHSSSSRCSI